MEWKDVFAAHVRFLGERWVDEDALGEAVLAPGEQRSMLRKKQLFKEKRAEIEKAVVRAWIVQREKKREDQVIEYRLHTQWLIRQNDHFHVEERAENRQSVLHGAQLFDDGVKKQPLGEPNEEPDPNQRGGAGEPAVRAAYDRLEAVRYAENWWNRRNPRFPNVTNDCTNYVSQCLFAGGIPMTGQPVRNRGWWHQRNNWSFSWAVANSLCLYLNRSGNIIGAVEEDRPEKLVPGDVICYDFEGDGRWNHNTIVTAKDAFGEPLVNAHTYDCRMREWSYRDSPAWTENIRYKFFHIKDRS
ncbi:hypothetical protein EWH99_05040 [Sporolactobacillus sp. THM7-7]|nr:hypothetical protein EWH99_05040 [Sporolactobacillus sp. THM7-7]